MNLTITPILSTRYTNNRINRPKIQFNGTPKTMLLLKSAGDNFEKLKDGSYLDIHDDSFAPQNKEIREHNLSFLDNLTYQEKKEFVEYYCKLTGFPNLEKVSEKIEAEFINSINNVSKKLDGSEYDCIAAGYDETCSVGKRKAFPGSDLDKAFILLRGSKNPEQDIEIVNKFKSELWSNTDQRILSFNHDTSFPTVYTLSQLYYFLNEIDLKTPKIKEKKKTYFSYLIENEYNDLDKASKYNILIANQFPEPELYDSTLVINRENVKNFAFFIEPLRDGKIVIKDKNFKSFQKYLSQFDFYNFSNVTQIRAMENAIKSGKEQKNKINLRSNIKNDFSNWSDSKKFNFIRTLIKYSCEDEEEFSEYFKNDYDIKSKYRHLLSLLTKQDEKFFYNPKFYLKPDGAAIMIGENIYVDLYLGYCPEVLWINNSNTENIKQVLLHIDKIRKINIFNKINRVQCPAVSNIKDFYKIQYKTANNEAIYERKL